MTGVTWHAIVPLTADLFRCDFPDCGEQADTIHLLPWCGNNCEQVLFACAFHDAGGYWLRVDEWIDDREFWVRHLDEKVDHRTTTADRPGGLGLLLAREQELTYPVAELHVVVHVPPRDLGTNGGTRST
jgi:hypothetical protein